MSAQQIWRLRDKKTGEWQQHVFFEEIDLEEMIDGRRYELVPMRLLGPDELDPATVERCAGVADMHDHRGDVGKAIRSLTGSGNV